MKDGKFLGIIVTPANVQDEGLEQVFNNIESVQASAIALDPWLLVPADPDSGARMPDLHIDGHARLLTRPLWGQREVYVKSVLAFEPDEGLYVGGPYKPNRQPLPSGLDPDLPHLMIAEARRRGMQAHMEITPLLPPNPRPMDRPVRVDGVTIQPPWIAENICLNSPGGKHYSLALIQDILDHYPEVDGLILDWVEFGAYRLEDHFTCFCQHCEARALEHELDWKAIRQDVDSMWNWLHALTPHKLEHSRRAATNPSEILELLVRFPGWLTFLKFKADSVLDFYQRIREQIDRSAREQVSLTARGWCPPWNRSSGMAYHSLSAICQAVAPKFFTFDHAAIPGWFGQTLLDWNPDLSEGELLEAVIVWLNLPDEIEGRSLSHYRIPAPEVPHPARMEAYRQRIAEIVDQVGGRALCYPIAHPYLPQEQWRQMVALIRDSRADGMWVNFYSYLSEPRLEALRQIWLS